MNDPNFLSFAEFLVFLRQQFSSARKTSNSGKLHMLFDTYRMIQEAALYVGDSFAVELALEMQGAIEDIPHTRLQNDRLVSDEEIRSRYTNIQSSLDLDMSEQLKTLLREQPLQDVKLEDIIQIMDATQHRLFACDCIEHIFTSTSAKRLEDLRLDEVIVLLRRAANTPNETDRLKALDLTKVATKSSNDWIRHIAQALSLAADPNSKAAALSTAYKASAIVANTHVTVDEWNPKREKEYQWQKTHAYKMVHKP